MNEEKLTQQKLESYLWGCAEHLRNKIDAGDYKMYIFPMLFYKRVSDVYDEEYQTLLGETRDDKFASNPINHRFRIPEGCHWSDLRKVTKDVGIKIQKSMQEIGKVNSDTLYDILTYNLDTVECLCCIIEYFIENNKINDKDISDILEKSYVFLKYYNNNYRPIYHLESIMFYIVNKVHKYDKL